MARISALAASMTVTVTIAAAGGAAQEQLAPPSSSDDAAPRTKRVGFDNQLAEGYPALVSLFKEWRKFQKPSLVDNVPDYGATAMAQQFRELSRYQADLAAISTDNWPVDQKVDYQIVRAEMNGLDFNHRVLRPWVRDPAFYATVFAEQSDTPAHEGQVAIGEIELWMYNFPLDEGSAARLAVELKTVPPLLAQARSNLTGNARDLWGMGIAVFDGQASTLLALDERVTPARGELHAAIADAAAASLELSDWLAGELPGKTGPSGVGVENYEWYARHVHLNPFSWQQEVDLMKRELGRAYTALELEENRNRRLEPLSRIANTEEFDRHLNTAVDDYMAFLATEEIVTVRPYMEPAMRARISAFVPAEGLRGFFAEIDYRDHLVHRTHFFHWIDLARFEVDPLT